MAFAGQPRERKLVVDEPAVERDLLRQALGGPLVGDEQCVADLKLASIDSGHGSGLLDPENPVELQVVFESDVVEFHLVTDQIRIAPIDLAVETIDAAAEGG